MSLPTMYRRGLANRVLGLYELGKRTEIPVFLCPALLRPKSSYFPVSTTVAQNRKLFRTSSAHSRPLSSNLEAPSIYNSSTSVHDAVRLPAQCSGCGALSQTVDNEEAGFYSLSRRSIKSYLGIKDHSPSRRAGQEYGAVEAALKKLDPEMAKSSNPQDSLTLGQYPTQTSRLQTVHLQELKTYIYI